MDEHDRRSFLRAVGGTAVAGATGLAGCLDGVPVVGGGSTATASYEGTLPAPDAVPGGEKGVYWFDSTVPATLQAKELAWPAGADYLHRLEARWPFDAVGADDVERLTRFLNGRALVAAGGFDGADLADELESDEWGGTEAGTAGEFDVYEARTPSEDRSVVVGVADETFVLGRTPLDDAGLVEAVQAARAEETDRYVATNDDVSLLVSHLETGTLVHGGPTRRSQAAVTGAAWTLNGDSVDFRGVAVYGETDPVPVERLETWVDDAPLFEAFESASMEVQDRAAVVEGTVRTGHIRTLYPRWPGERGADG